MSRLTRRFAWAMTALFVAAAMSIAVADVEAAEAVKYTKESLAEYEQQRGAGEVVAVTFNRKLRSMRVTLKDGRHVLAKYEKRGFPEQQAKLKGKAVHVTVLSQSEANKEAKEQPKHHKIRYIVGGVLIIVILLVGGVLLYRRRGTRD
jgi:hypothetical protein